MSSETVRLTGELKAFKGFTLLNGDGLLRRLKDAGLPVLDGTASFGRVEITVRPIDPDCSLDSEGRWIVKSAPGGFWVVRDSNPDIGIATFTKKADAELFVSAKNAASLPSEDERNPGLAHALAIVEHYGLQNEAPDPIKANVKRLLAIAAEKGLRIPDALPSEEVEGSAGVPGLCREGGRHDFTCSKCGCPAPTPAIPDTEGQRPDHSPELSDESIKHVAAYFNVSESEVRQSLEDYGRASRPSGESRIAQEGAGARVAVEIEHHLNGDGRAWIHVNGEGFGESFKCDGDEDDEAISAAIRYAAANSNPSPEAEGSITFKARVCGLALIHADADMSDEEVREKQDYEPDWNPDEVVATSIEFFGRQPLPGQVFGRDVEVTIAPAPPKDTPGKDGA